MLYPRFMLESLSSRLALVSAVVFVAAACGASGGGTTTTSTGTGAGGSPTSTASTGDMGGASTATATSTASTGGAPGCMANTDCTDPALPACDTKTGACVECLPSDDKCPMGKYCAPDETCKAGCKNQMDCAMGTQCDPSKNTCVGCIQDTDCAPGTVCALDQTCQAGCSATQGCAGSDTCCNQSQCYDLTKTLQHCGDCAKACPLPPHAKPFCKMSMCGYTCDQGFSDCNGLVVDGCEWNVLQDGPCTCTPGSTQSCYDGAPATLGVGVCKAGTQTCDPAGTTWGPCVGEVLPSPQQCVGLDEDCDNVPQPAGCSPCTAGTGSCNGTMSQYCPAGLGYVYENCDPLEGMTCNPQTGQCVGACSVASLGTSYIGCDYFPTVTANLVDTSFHFAAAVSNTSANSATVTVTKGANVIQTVTVAPNSVQIIILPWDLTLKGPSSGSVVPFPASVFVTQGAYRLRSTQPVSVYQFNPLEYTLNGLFSYSNDASILLPTNVWTGTYRVAARHHFAGGSGFYAVTARDDGTVVTVTAGPGGGTVKGGINGIPASGNGTVTLNSGDVIEVVTNGTISQSDPDDVTGTLVSATKPVQVIGGHQCIYIPDLSGYCDHLEESMFPFETLSQKYLVTAPLIPTSPATTKSEFVRIIATKPNTSLTYDPPQAGAPSFITQAGQWVEIAGTTNDFQITGSDPILVVQYFEGQTVAGNIGDPAMSIAVPQDQYRKSYLFHAPTNYDNNYVNVTAPTGAVVTLDGAAVGGFVAVGGTGFSVARAPLSNAGSGNHTISSPQAFGISVYGYGQYTSYWYPGGTELIKLHN
jgi:IgGFc binding protein